MSVTINAEQHHTSKSKVLVITVLFVLSLLTFVTQTEFTSQAYALGFNEPIVMLVVTHGLWWSLWPLQMLVVAVTKVVRRKTRKEYVLLGNTGVSIPQSGQNVSTSEYFKRAIIKQIHNVYHTSIIVYECFASASGTLEIPVEAAIAKHERISKSSLRECLHTFVVAVPVRHIVAKAAWLTVLLTVAGFTWYGAMSITYASDVTAIYNCSAFTAYVFAIPLLKESFSWLKASSVGIAVTGVFIVAYSGSDDDAHAQYPYRFWGNLAISVGAVIYGLYEVFYKRYCCIPGELAKLITPRRQLIFANFVMALLGVFTCGFLVIFMSFAHVTGIHKFNFFNYDQSGLIWAYIVGCIASNLTFSVAFLSLISLTSPVLSSVSSLLTIFLIGVVEWILFDNKLSTQQLIGDFLVIVGFVILTKASWNEISEGNDVDDVEIVSTYSFAISTNEPSEEHLH